MRLGVVERGVDAESLALSADGAYLAVFYREELNDLMLAKGVPGLERASGAP